jgi:CspA family cold shock protein
MYQVSWFSKKKGYGFVEDSEHKQFFVHHTDIQVSDGFRYLKEGEFISGVQEPMDGDKVKIAQIKAPMEGGRLMCEIERQMRASRGKRRQDQDQDQEPDEEENP